MYFLRLIELSVFQNSPGFACGVTFLQVFATVGLAFAADDSDARLH
jgi:hypothetical protein